MIWIRTSISTLNFYTEHKINDKVSKTLPINSNFLLFFHLDIRTNKAGDDMCACMNRCSLKYLGPKGENIIVKVIYRPPNQSVDELLKILIH